MCDVDSQNLVSSIQCLVYCAAHFWTEFIVIRHVLCRFLEGGLTGCLALNVVHSLQEPYIQP